MKRTPIVLSVLLLVVTILISCGAPSKLEQNINKSELIRNETSPSKMDNGQKNIEKIGLEKETAIGKPAYSNPQTYQVIRTLVIKNETATVNALHVWLPNIASLECQKDIIMQNTSPNVTSEWRDQQLDTSISFWEFKNQPAINSSITITDEFMYTCYAIDCKDFPEQIPFYDKSDPQYILFTQSEKYIESENPRIIGIANEVAGNNTNPLQKAKLLYNWLINYLSYQKVGGLKGATFALENRYGECGDYSALFVALCRAEGIPARPIVGRLATSINDNWHLWAEFYLPKYGWIPVDPTFQDLSKGANYFGHIDNKRMIFNKQYNIGLHPSPSLIAPILPVLQTFVLERSGSQGKMTSELDYIIRPVSSK